MTHAPKSQLTTPDFIEVLRAGKPVRTPIANVSHFVAADKYVTAHTDQGEVLLVSSLTKLQVIYGDRVVLIHRKCLVFRNRIARAHKPTHNGSSITVLTNGQELRTSYNGFLNYLTTMVA